MINDAVRIGLRENVSSLKALSLKAYRELARHNVLSYYKLCAISNAAGMLKNHRKAARKRPHTVKRPYAKKLMLTTCYGFKIEAGILKIPVGQRCSVDIPLNRHTREVLSRPGYTARSVCLTARTVSIIFSKETTEIEPAGLMGIDCNLDNVTIASSDGSTRRFDLAEATRVKLSYGNVKSHFKRNDTRIRRRIYGKYGVKQRNRVNPLLHRASRTIVNEAKAKRFGIVMEKLTGIRRLYRRGNWQARNYRGRMNGWSYFELQRQIAYKAQWEGLPVVYVPAQRTSSVCAMCGSPITECAERLVWCLKCWTLVDRDLNAARNIAARGLRFSPDGLAREAMVSVKR